MVFSSILFLFLFLPIVLTGYHVLFFLCRRWRFGIAVCNAFLLLSSLLFYAWGETWLTVLMLITAGVDYLAGLLISAAWHPGEVRLLDPIAPRTRFQRTVLVTALCTNLGLLVFFKYIGFLSDNLSAIIGFIDFSHDGFKWPHRVALPLGISFYVFQSMSYTIDVYRGNTRASRSLLNFLCYVTLFPQLIAGPIVRYRDIAEQLRRRLVTHDRFASGVARFIIGLAKKVVIANSVAVPADAVFGADITHLTTMEAWLGCLCYGVQIYFDFSGYSDMAIGLGRIFGFEFLENFNYPYASRSVREFWRRWHISLSEWFRDYLYIPLGGNRYGSDKTCFNLLTVFFLCGLWHGASWTFVLWGLYHGIFMILERTAFGAWIGSRWKPLQHIYTMFVVFMGWVLFRSSDLHHALGFYRLLFGLNAAEATSVATVKPFLSFQPFFALLAGLLISMPVIPAARRMVYRIVNRLERMSSITMHGVRLAEMLILGALMLACALLLASGTHNPFIYFRF